MTAIPFTSTTTSTTDALKGVPLYLRRDGDGYMVTDVIGLRYGWGNTIGQALQEWVAQVFGILDYTDDELSDPLLNEVRRYREALR